MSFLRKVKLKKQLGSRIEGSNIKATNKQQVLATDEFKFTTTIENVRIRASKNNFPSWLEDYIKKEYGIAIEDAKTEILSPFITLDRVKIEYPLQNTGLNITT